jgi:hypothetical protein
MPEIPLGLSARKRSTVWNPQIRVLNLLAEQSVTNRFNGVDHIQRPGLAPFADLGAGVIRGVFRQAGTFDGDFLVTHDETLYRVDADGLETSLGAVTGSDRTITAATATRSITVGDSTAFSSDGTTVTPVVMPDSRLVSSVAQLNGYFILTEEASARFYWIEPGQVDPDGLSFATTESSPGNNVIVIRVGDELWFLKEEGTEVWAPTGDPDLPFQRIAGRNYDKGCRAKDTVCRFDNSVAWVGNDGLVYRGAESPTRFSDHALEEQIRKSDPLAMRAWSFAIDGHTLYCLTLEEGTYAYDLASEQWSEFGSYERDHWRAHVGDAGDTFIVAGDDESGLLYILDAELSNDNGEPLVRRLTGGIPVLGQPQRCDSFNLYVTTGTATDPNLYPKARISWSDDLQTYEDWEDVSIGRQGNYGEPVRLNRLGMMRYPGRLFQIQVTDDVVATISAAAYNEPSR